MHSMCQASESVEMLVSIMILDTLAEMRVVHI